MRRTLVEHLLHIFTIPVLLLIAALLVACSSVQYIIQEPYYVTENVTENVTESFSEILAVTKSVPHEQLLTPYVMWSNPQLRFKESLRIWYYGYNLADLPAHEKENIRITFFKQTYYENLSFSVFDMTPRGQLLAPPLLSPADQDIPAINTEWITTQGDATTLNTWLNAANYKFDFAHFLGGASNVFLNLERPDPIAINTRGAKDIALVIYGPSFPQNCRFSASLQWQETITENVTVSGQRIVPVQMEQRITKQRTVVKTKQVPFWESLINQPR